MKAPVFPVVKKEEAVKPHDPSEENYHSVDYPSHIVSDSQKDAYCKSMATSWVQEMRSRTNTLPSPSTSADTVSKQKGDRRGTMLAGNIIKKSLDEFFSSSDGGGDASSCGEEERGVLKSSFSTVRYDPDRNLGRFIFGKDFRPRTSLFLLVTLPHTIGCFPFYLALWNFIPRDFLYLSVLSWPLMVYIALTLNIDLAMRVAVSPASITNCLWSAAFFVSSIFEYQESQGAYYGIIMNGMFLNTLCMILVPFFDAFPAHIRIVINRYTLSAFIMVIVAFQLALYYNWSNCNYVHLSLFGNYINVSAGSLMSSALNTFIIFMTLNVITSWIRPTNLITVVSGTRSIILSEKEAQALRALDATAEVGFKHFALVSKCAYIYSSFFLLYVLGVDL